MTATKHIIDILIVERAPRLAASPFWRLLKPALDQMLNYNKAVVMADMIAPLSGQLALEAISCLLSVKTTINGAQNIPTTGRCIIIANHPTGIADGIAAWDAIKAIRPDLMFYANADAHRVCAGFGDVLIPVEWELHKRTREKTRETLLQTGAAMAAERALFIFPAGKLARRKNGVLTEPEWMNSAVALARKNNAPIVPIHLSGPNSFWFHFFDRFSGELRDITLFKELLNKRHQKFELVVGPLIKPEQLYGDATFVTAQLKNYVTDILARNRCQNFAV